MPDDLIAAPVRPAVPPPRADPSGPAARALVLAVSGALAGTAYWPSGCGWLMWGAVAPLLWAVEGMGPRRAFLWSWLWGVCAWGAALHWFLRVSLEFAAGPAPVRLLLALGVIAYHGLQLPAALCAARWLACRLERRGWGSVSAALAAAAPCLVAAEGLFPQVYPSCVAATQLNHLPAVQLVDLAGPGGLTWLIVGVNCLLYAAWRLPRRRFAALAAAAALAGADEAYGLARIRQADAASARALASGRVLRVAVLQGVLPLCNRNTGASAEANIAFYRDLTRQALDAGHAELVLWPHNTYERVLRFGPGDPGLERPALAAGPLAPRLAQDLPFPVYAVLSAAAESPATDSEPWPSRHFVSVLKDPAGGVAGSVAKVHPTPLAEEMPFGSLLPALYRLRPKLKRVLPGPSRVLTLPDGRRLGVVICYDAATPRVARGLARAGAEVLLNPSSDQWSYDKRVQPWQHLRIVMLRAVENRRWYARATPSGVSAVVDPAGRLVRALAVDETGHMTQILPLLDGRTPAMSLGGAAYGLAAAALLALAALSARAARPGGGAGSPG